MSNVAVNDEGNPGRCLKALLNVRRQKVKGSNIQIARDDVWRLMEAGGEITGGGRSTDGTGGKSRDRGRTKRGRGWIRRSDRREDSITRHQQPGAYLVAIGFSLPKASPGFIPNCTFGDPP
ncbi:PREDICTED: uncharacterized protein LOC108759786 [Trachymyrmex cornetzi]|uniref:uncharacterized protein LOC108759786 n=1 Tax=Trachymyrmex cornetzi TaxID=471704 RepID=UPI00084EDE08|nr:PREDICTED: uncharacterized protein LOC108759786 [Trachymyrmex cornetzi]